MRLSNSSNVKLQLVNLCRSKMKAEDYEKKFWNKIWTKTQSIDRKSRGSMEVELAHVAVLLCCHLSFSSFTSFASPVTSMVLSFFRPEGQEQMTALDAERLAHGVSGTLKAVIPQLAELHQLLTDPPEVRSNFTYSHPTLFENAFGTPHPMFE